MGLNFNSIGKLVRRPAVRWGVMCITLISSSVVSAQRRESPANIRMPSFDAMTLPEPQRPGTHIMVLRANHAYSNNSTYSYKGYPVIGLLNHGNLNCEHGQRFGVAAQGSGASLIMSAGFGQVAGSGREGSGDRCVAWVTQAAVDFDVSPFASLPVATLIAATLSYREQESPACLVLAYTQGGFAIDSLRCHTNAQGAPEAKPDGCIVLATPIDDWVAHTPTGVLQTVPNYSRKNGPGSWDVMSLVQSRLNPPLGTTRAAFGHGFLLVGPPKSARSLSARNNTRCASMLSDIKLTLRYTVPPYDPRPHPNVIK